MDGQPASCAGCGREGCICSARYARGGRGTRCTETSSHLNTARLTYSIWQTPHIAPQTPSGRHPPPHVLDRVGKVEAEDPLQGLPRQAHGSAALTEALLIKIWPYQSEGLR